MVSLGLVGEFFEVKTQVDRDLTIVSRVDRRLGLIKNLGRHTTSSPSLSGLALPFSWHLFWQRLGTCGSTPYTATGSTTYCLLARPPLLPRGHDRCWTGSGASVS
jgi:hypothetical protein